MGRREGDKVFRSGRDPMRTPAWRGPLARRQTDRLPANPPVPPALRRRPQSAGESADDLARDEPLARVEAALLAADEPLAPRRLAAVAGLADAAEARRLAERLRDLYDRGGSAFTVDELAGGYQLRTRPEFHPWLARLRQTAPAEARLTPALTETLAIVAYRQPITRADVEA